MATAASAAALAAFTPAAASSGWVSCKAWSALQVTSAGQHYVVRNKPSVNNNDLGMCISDPGRGPGFVVTRSPGTAPTLKVRAYPYIGTGCFEHACATGSSGATLPKAGSLGKYTVHWTTVTPPHSGVWNVSLDLWLGAKTGDGNSEVMIWLQYSKPAWWAKRSPIVTIDGTRWYVVKRPGSGNHYLSFRRATPADGATLKIAPFMAAAERFGVVTPSERLWCTQAGFEIFSGGKGLAVKDFSVTG